MTVIIFFAIGFIIGRLAQSRINKRRCLPAPVIVMDAPPIPSLCDSSGISAKAQQKRDQSVIDYDHYAMQRDRLMELADVVENELTHGNITDKRRAALMRQRITLEERLHQTEKKINKAYFNIHN